MKTQTFVGVAIKALIVAVSLLISSCGENGSSTTDAATTVPAEQTINAVLMSPEQIGENKNIITMHTSISLIKSQSESGEVKTCNCAVYNPNYPWEGLPGHDPSTKCIVGNCHETCGCGVLWVEDV